MRWKTLISLLFLSSSCNFAPHYSRPDVAMPSNWRTESDENTKLANLRWWEALDDPVLDQLIDTALKYNNDLQVAIWRVREYYGQYQIVRSGLYPQVNLQSFALKERLSPDGNFIPSGTSPVIPDFGAEFTLSYELDFWGQITNAAYAAYSEYLAQIENRRTVVLTLVASVAQAYINLRSLDLQLKISCQTLEARREALEIACYRFKGGLTSESEVTQADSAYEEALASVYDYQRLVPQQENLLSILIGQNPSSIMRGKGLDEFTLPLDIPAGLPSELLTRRPDIVQQENLLIASNANIGVARAAFFPQISLTSLLGWDSFQLKNFLTNGGRTWQIGGNLLQAIFTGGRLSGQLKVAEAQQKEALFQYEQTILNALREVDDALIGHQQSIEIVGADRADVAALSEYLHLSWARYYEGLTDYLNVLDAERELFTAELTLAQAIGDQFTTLVDIYKALGGGWVIDADENLVEEKTYE